MTASTAPVRQRRGIPAGGQFAPQSRDDSDIGLGTNWPTTPVPNQDQLDRARVEAERQRIIYELSAAETESLHDSIALRIADQEAAYTAFKAGLSHPDDAEYAAVWAGDRPGFSEATALDIVKSLKAQIEFPHQFTHRSDPRETDQAVEARAASQKLAAQAELPHWEEALACGGRNISINQIGVVNRRKARERAEAPF